MRVAWMLLLLLCPLSSNGFVCTLLQDPLGWDRAARSLAVLYSARSPYVFQERLPMLLESNSSFRLAVRTAQAAVLAPLQDTGGPEAQFFWIYQIWLAPFHALYKEGVVKPNPNGLLLAMISEQAGGANEAITQRILAAATRLLNEEQEALGLSPRFELIQSDQALHSGYLPVVLPGGEYSWLDVATLTLQDDAVPRSQAPLIDRLWESLTVKQR
jgi:hypothetical protein